MNLYKHQLVFVDQLRSALMRYRSVMGQAPTGAGKTVVGSYIARSVTEKNKTVVFAVHRKNLLTQTARTFDNFGIQYGYIAAGMSYYKGLNVYIASIDTLRNRLDKIPAPSLLVIDEAHMAAAATWTKVADHYRQRGSRLLGLSATPARLDGKPLSDLFEHIVHGPPVRWLMDNGFLSDYVAYAPSAPDLSGVHTRMGEYVNAELEAAIDRPTITGSAVAHFKKLAYGTRAICYCCSIKHSEHVAADFNAAGIPAAHIDGETPRHEQQRVIQDFADGRIMVLCNVELITTGFDLAAQVGRDVPVETIIGLRPTQSLTLHLQMIGRGLRAKPKPAIWLDHSNNIARHGFPDDDREWSLEGRQKRSQAPSDALPIRQCGQCYHVHRPAPACPQCGFVYPVQSREIEQVDGTLEQIDAVAMAARKKIDLKTEIKQARSLQDLEAIGRRMGHKPGWAWFIWNGKKAAHQAYSTGQRRKA